MHLGSVLDWVTAISAANKPLALAIIAALLVLGALVFIPRQPICLVAGFLFGMSSLPVIVGASVAGCLLGFYLARYVARPWFAEKVKRHPLATAAMDAVSTEGWMLVFMLRLASPVPGTITNYMFGLTDMSPAKYTVATVLGLVPQLALFVYLGMVGEAALTSSSVPTANAIMTAIGVATFAICSIVVSRRVHLILSEASLRR